MSFISQIAIEYLRKLVLRPCQEIRDLGDLE